MRRSPDAPNRSVTSDREPSGFEILDTGNEFQPAFGDRLRDDHGTPEQLIDAIVGIAFDRGRKRIGIIRIGVGRAGGDDLADEFGQRTGQGTA